jgi:hypothetical protein
MADVFLARARDDAAGPAPEKWPSQPARWAIVLVAIVMLLVVAALLLLVVRLDSSSEYGVSASRVRAALTAALDRDLATDRLQDVLLATTDPSPGVDEKAQGTRKTERTSQVKTIAVRLNGARGDLLDALTAVVLTPHPGADTTVVGAATAVGKRKAMGVLAADRLAKALRDRTIAWVKTTLDDAPSQTAAGKAAASVDVVATAVADALAAGSMRRAVTATIDLPFEPMDTRPAETAWAVDVTARLVWLVAAMLLSVAFVFVVVAAGQQIALVAPSDRGLVIGCTVVACLVAGALAHLVASVTTMSTPLQAMLDAYANVFHVGIPSATKIFNVVRAIGVVVLVAASIATFGIEVKTPEELKAQLRGFKTLFNSSAAFLLAGTYEGIAAYRWPLTFVSDATIRGPLDTTAAMLASTVGAICSVVLLSAYVVTTVLLRRQALAAKIDEKEVDTAFTTFGFGDLSSSQALRFAQVLAPLIPGALSFFT